MVHRYQSMLSARRSNKLTATTTTPASRVRRGDDIRLVMGGADPSANRDQRLIDRVVRAYQRLLASEAGSTDALATEYGHSRKYFSRLLRLATLAPDIVTAILDGGQPAGMSRGGLLAAGEFQVSWLSNERGSVLPDIAVMLISPRSPASAARRAPGNSSIPTISRQRH